MLECVLISVCVLERVCENVQSVFVRTCLLECVCCNVYVGTLLLGCGC